jgi:rRNA maturation RNase YbeY
MPSSIYFFKSDVQFRFSRKASIIKWIERVIKKEGKKTGSINFIFCSDLFLLGINKQYLKHDYFTDIITFDYSEGKNISGEIYISIDRVTENANSLGIKIQHELSRVIIHGVLHLLGYSDHTKSEKKEMRKKEDACLSLLRSST